MVSRGDVYWLVIILLWIIPDVGSLIINNVYINATGTATISSPLYPNHYPDSVDVAWIVETEENRKVHGSFLSFHTERLCDYFRAGDGIDCTNYTTMFFEWSGEDPTKNLFSDENVMWLRFTSEGSVRDTGFSLSVRSVLFHEEQNCSFDEFDFGHSVCLNSIYQCNGRTDCVDGSDELCVLPANITLSDSTGNFTSNGGTSYVVDGVDHRFVCEVPGINPGAQFTWSADGGGVTVDGVRNVMGNNGLITSTGMAILSPTWANHGGAIRCQASNKEGHSGISTSVTLDVKVLPSSITLSDATGNFPSNGGTSYVVDGVDHRFACEVPGINPGAQFTWSADGGGVTVDRVRNVIGANGLTTSTGMAILSPTWANHGGAIRCRASNKNGHSGISTSVTLNVKVLPSSITLSDATGNFPSNGGTSYVVDGVDHRFACEVPGINPGAQFTWSADGGGVTVDRVRNVIGANGLTTSTGMAILSPTWANHGGAIRCQTSNKVGHSGISTSATLDVKVPPKRTSVSLYDTNGIRLSEALDVDQGTPYNFTCEVRGTRPAVTIQWFLTSILQHTTAPPFGGGDQLVDTTGVWTFTPGRGNHQQELRCVASIAESKDPLPFVRTRFYVIGPPDTPTISGNAIMTEGSRVSLRCSANQGYPRDWRLTWSNGNQTVAGRRTTARMSGNRYSFTGMLYFTPQRDHNGNIITCQAERGSLASAARALGPIVVSFCARNVSIICPIRASIGSSVSFSCASESSNPASALTWTRNRAVQNSTLPLVMTSGDHGGEVTTLNLTAPVTTKTEHGDVFRCCTTITSTCPVRVCDRCLLNVEYSVVFVKLKSVPAGPITEGGDLVLSCTADANPRPPGFITWERVGSTVPLTSTHILGANTLTLSNITREQAGPYRCRGDNGISPVAYSHHVSVIVHYGVNTSTDGESVGAKEGYEAVMVCTVNGNPIPRVTWIGPAGTQVPNQTDPGRVAQSDTIIGGDDVYGYTIKSVLRISSVIGTTDYGSYTCNGDNSVGISDTNTIQLNNKVQPSSPQNVSVHPIWSVADSVLVTWTLGNDNGEPQWFYVNVREIETTSDFGPSRRSSKIKGATSEYELTGLRPSTAYEIQVYAENVNGAGEAVSVTFTTPLGGFSKLILLIAITAALAVIAFVSIVLFIVACYRGRNIKSEQGTKRHVVKPVGRSAETVAGVTEAQEIQDVGIPLQAISSGQDNFGECAYDSIPNRPMEFPRDKLSIVRELGHGAFSKVLLAGASGIAQEGVVTNVTVKTLRDGAVSPMERGDLIREMNVMESLPSHKNVIRLLGYCINQDPVYIIMEYLAQGTLSSLLKVCKKGSLTLSSKDLIRFARDVADAMTFLSSQHVIHGDVAARNVLVGQDLVCKLANFEFARNAKNERVHLSDCQGRLPLRWMAPESIVNGLYTTQSDIWSFGVLLWEIVTLGARPYAGMSAKKMIAQIQQGYRMPKPDQCHEELYQVMLTCWFKEPKDRLTFKKAGRKLERLLSVSNEYILLEIPQESAYEDVTIPRGAAKRR